MPEPDFDWKLVDRGGKRFWTVRLDEPIMALLERGPLSQVDIGLALGFSRVGRHRQWINAAMTRLKSGGRARCEGHGQAARWVATNLYQHAAEP